MATKWKKLNFLGAGSYGKVYLVTPMNLSSSSTPLAAVKSANVLHSSSLQTESLYLSELGGHPNIIRCFGNDISIENGQEVYNLLLEYAPGGSLHDLINKNKGIIPETFIACYTAMLLRGLSFIHEENIVHCDIKPGNILVFPDENGINQLKIADFGLAKKVSGVSHQIGRMGNRNRGTILYASPESVIFGLHETGHDIWSLGCTVVEMITGERIWSSYKDVRDLLCKIMFSKPKIPEGISKDAKDFLERCFERELSKRWTANMLLNHPFIVNNMQLLYGTHDPPYGCSNQFQFNPFGSTQWTSTIDLF